MSRTIKSISPLNVTAPNIVFNTSNLNLTSTPVVNNSNNNLLSRNNLTGNFEVVDTLTSTFKTDLQNVGGFNTLVQTPGSATTHNIKTIRSTTGSIAITSAATNLDLNANVMLSNLPSGGSAVLSNPGSGNSFNFKTLLANTGISISDNVDNVFVGLNPMTPGEIGGIYGSQRATEDNRIGFKNFVPDGSKSNVIGSELPSSLLGESSNIISSYINLSTANGTFSRSNVILSGDNSEINSTVNTHVMANDFAGSGLDMESSLYIGNMRNTRPTTVSACINQNLYGNTIEMGKNSWYIGSGRNPISLAPNEMHFDTGCDRLYYHDLATGSNSDVLFYDPVSGLITHENTSVLPPPPTVNIYNSNGTLTSNRTMTLGGFNLTISGVGAITIVSSAALTLDSSLGAVNLGTSTATSVGVGRSGINTTLGGNLFASHLALDNTKLDYLAYDSASKQIFYNAVSNIPLNNIYNANGSVSSNRLVTVPTATSLTFNGSGTSSFSASGFQTNNISASVTAAVTSGQVASLTGQLFTYVESGVGGSVLIGPSNSVSVGIGGSGSTTTVSGNSLSIQTTSTSMPGLLNSTANSLMYFNSGSGQISRSAIVNNYGVLRFLNQTSQTITSTLTQEITAGSYSGFTISGSVSDSASRYLLYSGATSRAFRISFTGNISVATGSQVIGISIFINGSRIDETTNTATLGASGNYILNTCDWIRTLNTGDLVTIGFSRSAVDTTVTFTGTLSIQASVLP